MEPKDRTVNGEVAIDFKGDGSYSQRPPHSPTFGHATWSTFNMENQTPQVCVSCCFVLCFTQKHFRRGMQFFVMVLNKPRNTCTCYQNAHVRLCSSFMLVSSKILAKNLNIEIFVLSSEQNKAIIYFYSSGFLPKLFKQPPHFSSNIRRPRNNLNKLLYVMLHSL